jgi:hypothetical protein
MNVMNVKSGTIDFLLSLADRLDGWASASENGGWSTHQVKANRDAANDCRRQAAILRQDLEAELSRVMGR